MYLATIVMRVYALFVRSVIGLQLVRLLLVRGGYDYLAQVKNG